MGRRRISPTEIRARSRFGASLLRARNEKGWGLHEAARASGLNHTSLSRIESGERPINLVDLHRLAEAYDVPWEALVIAQRGQLPMALVASVAQIAVRGEKREERFTKRVTPAEKQQLEIFFGYLRFTLQFTGSDLPGSRT